ncbi:MAG: alpha/beta hydrolase family protein [Promethearchaeota archaeon]|jgi:dienelactone hydrolase
MNNQTVKYDPFKRGPFPVGVISQELAVPKGERIVPTEIWYPATDEYQGQDLSEETKDKYPMMDPIPPGWLGPEFATQDAVRDANLREGSFPLIIYSHGHGGFRILTAYLCTHLASHGYVVASPDHLGNTFEDMMSFATKTEQELMEIETQVFINRPIDVRFLIDCVLENKTRIPSKIIDNEHIGVTGYSYGGWTILMATSRDERISVALPIASVGGAFEDTSLENPAYDFLNLDWKHDVHTLYLAAEKDSIVPISSIYDLFNRSHEPKGMVVLNNADHLHFSLNMEFTHEMIRSQPELLFGDTPITKQIKENMLPFSELISVKRSEDFLRSIGLAHMDAYLKQNSAAEEWLKGDVKSIMADKGIDIRVVQI